MELRINLGKKRKVLKSNLACNIYTSVINRCDILKGDIFPWRSVQATKDNFKIQVKGSQTAHREMDCVKYDVLRQKNFLHGTVDYINRVLEGGDLVKKVW